MSEGSKQNRVRSFKESMQAKYSQHNVINTNFHRTKNSDTQGPGVFQIKALVSTIA
jgi:hypothetical protein